MLKKLASDALGLSDIGRIISPSDYDKVDADDFIMHEDEEKIFFLIKSRTDEYCFTNLALIHVDGTSAVSKKRLVKRYDYYKNDIKHVMIETAGTVDLDCELKFTMGNVDFSIDVNRNQLEQLKDIYKALIKIAHIVEENNILLEKSQQTLNLAAQALLDNDLKQEIYLKSSRMLMNIHLTGFIKHVKHIFKKILQMFLKIILITKKE